MQNLLVCVDFSPLTERVLDTAKELAAALRAGVHLIHVQPDMSSSPKSVVTKTEHPEAAREMMREINSLMNMKQDLEDEGITATYSTPSGPIAGQISKTAKDLGAAYIVMGCHGNGAVYHLVVGSVAEAVLKTTGVPVVLVPRKQN